MMEIWKDIKNYKGMYQVSDLGSVRSLPRKNSLGLPRNGRTLKQNVRGGYYNVTLCKNATCKSRQVSHVVLETFVGDRPTGLQCCHNNGNRCDNRVVNLRWDTFANNMLDKIKHGKAYYGSKNPSAKINVTQAFLIKWLMSLGYFSQSEIAKRFNVTKPITRYIRDGRIWKKALQEAYGVSYE